MAQELRETAQAMLESDMKEIENILNRRPNGTFWIVAHHKPIPKDRLQLTSGEQIIMRVVKDYDTKPTPQLGTIVHTVKNGEIVDTEVNLHDTPIDWATVSHLAGDQALPFVQERPDLKGSYVYNQ
jgi:hypothetical protein